MALPGLSPLEAPFWYARVGAARCAHDQAGLIKLTISHLLEHCLEEWALRDQIKEMMIKEDAGRRSQAHFVRRTNEQRLKQHDGCKHISEWVHGCPSGPR